MDNGQLLFCALVVESGPLIINSIIVAGRVGRGVLTTPKTAIKQLHTRGSGGMPPPPPPPENVLTLQSLMIESGDPGVQIHQLLFINYNSY